MSIFKISIGDESVIVDLITEQELQSKISKAKAETGRDPIISIGVESFYPGDRVLWLAPVSKEVFAVRNHGRVGSLWDRLLSAKSAASSISGLTQSLKSMASGGAKASLESAAAAMGRKGGLAKKPTSAENGKKGGRPRKQPPTA